MDTSSTAQVAQITVKHRRSRGSSRTNFVRSPACWPRVWKKIEGGSIGTWMGKSTKLGMCVRSSETRIVLIEVRGWIWLSCGRNRWNLWIQENQHHFLNTKIWGWTQRESKANESVIDQHREMFESRLSATATELLPGCEKPRAKTVAWSYDMEGHAQKCAERNCELANENTEQLYKVSTPCLDDHNFQKEEARIGWLDILLSWNKFARTATEWTRACDLISYIHDTNDYRQYCRVGNTAQHCRLGLFRVSDFAGDLEDSKSTSGGVLCIFGSRTFVPTNWMCKKQTSVSHSSTESAIILLDAGFSMDGILALDFWDAVTEVLHTSNNQ